ncbi:MAG TPA: InlB B-repeat-containing protein, partial [Candidatus Sumerlaeota bacterium]|nr:InlB B-repeat-containing protein [Candidatus Sumerlaeota bacterium]
MYRCILVLLFILMAAAQLDCSAASWPVSTGFEVSEGYAVGALSGQNGWVTTNTVEVQAAVKHLGEQAVELTSQSEALYSVTTPADKKVWIEAFCKTTPTTEYPTLPAPKGVSCVLFFHADADKGITCLNGDGLGGGTWVFTKIQATEWTRIRVLQDYATHTWDLYVNGTRVLKNLGNAYNNAGFEKFECHASDSGSMFLDDFVSAAVPKYALNTATTGAGTGTVTKNPDAASYDENSTVTVTATANADSEFNGWTGDVPAGSEMTNPLVVAMNTTKTLTANFKLKPVQYALTVNVNPADSGTVVLNPTGGSYLAGTTVTLTATPNAGYRFVNWTGAVTSTSPQTAVVMDAAKSVTANFELIPTYELTLTDDPVGAAQTLTKTPAQPSYTEGATVTLATTPALNYQFRGWLDGSTTVSAAASFVYTMPAANKTLTAKFKALLPDQFTVNVVADPAVGGTVSKAPDQSIYTVGAQVTLTAVVQDGYTFDGWFDGATQVSSELTYVYTVAESKTFTAKFSKVVVPTYTLDLTVVPDNLAGTVSK